MPFLVPDEPFPCCLAPPFPFVVWRLIHPLSLGALSPYLQFIIPDFPLKSKKIALAAKKIAKTLGHIKNTPYLCNR